MSDLITPDALVKRLHKHAALRVRDAEDEGQWRLDTLAAADRIEALTAERDEAVALLREEAANGHPSPATHSFLARLDKENT